MMYGYAWLSTHFGPLHWLAFAVMVAVVIFPIGRILARTGFSPFWSLLLCVPMVNFIALWVFALADWPKSHKIS
jgi:hypothetical protein